MSGEALLEGIDGTCADITKNNAQRTNDESGGWRPMLRSVIMIHLSCTAFDAAVR
jgi:hypothetical protein